MHSGTKYLGGHSDLLAGLVVVNDEKLAEELKFIQNSSGGILGPHDCWLVIRGIETAALRVERQCENAAKVAAFLDSHPDVDHVNYPGLPSHKNHEIAKVQQNGLFGGMVSFSLKNDTEEAALAIVTSTKYFKLAESLGGVKSLLCHPSQMTHKSVPREKRLASGINDSLIRLSCGIEGADDLIEDLKQAFEKVRG
jgi:cystathionine beta-lyase